MAMRMTGTIPSTAALPPLGGYYAQSQPAVAAPAKPVAPSIPGAVPLPATTTTTPAPAAGPNFSAMFQSAMATVRTWFDKLLTALGVNLQGTSNG